MFDITLYNIVEITSYLLNKAKVIIVLDLNFKSYFS